MDKKKRQKSEKICGVYCIQNLVNGKRYIGKSVDINKRFKGHKNRLDSHTHHNCHLQRAWDIYGESNFEFSILEKCKTEELSLQQEMYWIKYYDSRNDANGYNQNDGGTGSTGYIYDEAGLQKLRESSHHKPIVQINIYTKEVTHWMSANHAFKVGGWFLRSINNALKGKVAIHDNCIWLYEEEYTEDFDVITYLLAKKNRRNTYYLATKYYQYSYDGNLIKIWTYEELTNSEDFTITEVIHCCNLKKKSHNNFIWLFEENKDKIDSLIDTTKANTFCREIEMFDLDMNYICSYPNVETASKELNIIGAMIRMICEGRYNYTDGKIFMFKDDHDAYFQGKLKREKECNDSYNNMGISIEQCDLDGNIIKIWRSIKQIRKELNYQHGSIKQCCLDSARTYKGYKWKYHEEVV